MSAPADRICNLTMKMGGGEGRRGGGKRREKKEEKGKKNQTFMSDSLQGTEGQDDEAYDVLR